MAFEFKIKSILMGFLIAIKWHERKMSDVRSFYNIELIRKKENFVNIENYYQKNW